MKKSLKLLIGVVLTIILFLGSFWVFLLIREHQTYALPKPTGTYHVGHTIYEWTDNNRTNAFAGKPQEERKLMVDMWYPTNQVSGASASYLPANWQTAADASQGASLLLKRPFENIRTNSISNPRVAVGTFPLVIFQPGYGRIAADYTSYTENLASHGYIVIADSPTYVSDLVVTSDGTKITKTTQSSLPENAPALSVKMEAASAKLLQVLVEDNAFLINKAMALTTDQKSGFYNTIDLSKIGEMGHSLGGAAAYQACKTDTRCKTAINMDGTIYGDATSSRVPYLLISSDHSHDQGAQKQEDDFNDNILAHQSQPTYRVSIANTAHFNFSDIALYSYTPIMQLFGIVGTINPSLAIDQSNAYVVDMLNMYLRQQPSRNLNSQNQPAGVTVQVLNPLNQEP